MLTGDGLSVVRRQWRSEPKNTRSECTVTLTLFSTVCTKRSGSDPHLSERNQPPLLHKAQHPLLVACYFGMSSVSTVIETRNTGSEQPPSNEQATRLTSPLPAATLSTTSPSHRYAARPAPRSASAHDLDPHTLQSRRSSCCTYLTALRTGTKASRRAPVSTTSAACDVPRFNSAVLDTGT
ncbi:hypothetical protein K438DRAFT_1769255 [Mycena galopus ATCC 62051]|nr:hypothetical protein K438DRAFT_1769255 [Mycena galopus ATCC 62051]